MTPNYASFGRRFAASLVDTIIVILIAQLVSLIHGLLIIALGVPAARSGLVNVNESFAYTNLAIAILTWVLIFSFYSPILVGIKGATLGKMLLKLKIVKEDGSRVTFWTAASREILGKLISSSIVSPLGYLWMLWDGKKQTWHDKIAGTIVVRV